MSKTAIIIGAGIAGPAAALSLIHYKSDYVPKLHELRSQPSTLGGAINLDPNALRVLKRLGLYEKILSAGQVSTAIDVWSSVTGSKLGQLTMKYKDFKSVRIMRSTLHAILLDACKEKNIQIHYGRQLTNVDVETGSVEFKDGTKDSGDVILGCDGTHSALRQYVDGRKPNYTGIDGSFGFSDITTLSTTARKELDHYLPRESTNLIRSGRGNMILCYCDATQPNLVYFGAVVEGHHTDEEISDKAGWKAKGTDITNTRQNLVDRFGRQRLGFLTELLGQSTDLAFYPIYKLEAGEWIKGRVVLLGDAAHAMPPQGQGVGLALEDAALLARMLAGEAPTEKVLQKFEKTRKPRIQDSYEKVARMKENVVDVAGGYWMNWIVEWMYWAALKLLARTVWGKDWGYNVDEIEISVSG